MGKYDEYMDEECIDFCDALNELPGVETYESCCGHYRRPYYVFLNCKDFVSLAIMARVFDRCYCDSEVGWEILAVTKDVRPVYGFWLRSKGIFKDKDQLMNDIKNRIEDIKYWSQDKFKEYFKA